MAVYDNHQTTELPKQNEVVTHFSDGGFYPFLKYFLNYVTKVPNEFIFIKDYAENNPFLEQSKTPKIYCEMYDFATPMISGNFDLNGDMFVMGRAKYRVYFVNDNWRAPFLFEASMKGNVDNLDNIKRAFIEVYTERKKKYATPQLMTMGIRKEHEAISVFPIISYDILMYGYLTQNIKELESMPFDDVFAGVILK